MDIIDGYRGEPHISAEQIADCNMGLYGTDSYILNNGNKFGYELVSNNLIKIKDGAFMMQGRRGNIRANFIEDIIIENGTQGSKRNDIIAIRYEKDNVTKIETFYLTVKKGAPGTTPVDPEIRQGIIRNGDAIHEMPLYRVSINGIVIEKIEPMMKYLMSAKELEESINQADKASMKLRQMRVVTVEGELNAGQFQKSFHYPDGFNYDNTFITGAKYSIFLKFGGRNEYSGWYDIALGYTGGRKENYEGDILCSQVDYKNNSNDISLEMHTEYTDASKWPKMKVQLLLMKIE